jgi:hypothetical protein
MNIAFSGLDFVTRKLCDISDSRGGETDAAGSSECFDISTKVQGVAS